MNLISKIFRRGDRLEPIFAELSRELSNRYGSSKNCYKGQIDRTLQEIEITEELTPYAYILYLKDDEFSEMKKLDPTIWTEKEAELQEYIDKHPKALGNGNFYESGIGDIHTP